MTAGSTHMSNEVRTCITERRVYLLSFQDMNFLEVFGFIKIKYSPVNFLYLLFTESTQVREKD